MIEEGIYVLEGTLQAGTGHTAKGRQTHRSLWVVCAATETSVDLMLLDDKGAPTGLVETVSPREVQAKYQHRPLSADTWARLRARVQAAYRPRTQEASPPPAPVAPASPAAPPPAAPPGGAPKKPADESFDTSPWWEKK